jgi:hypothetical protein
MPRAPIFFVPLAQIGEKFNVGKPCGLGNKAGGVVFCTDQHCYRSTAVFECQQSLYQRIELDNSRPHTHRMKPKLSLMKRCHTALRKDNTVPQRSRQKRQVCTEKALAGSQRGPETQIALRSG